MATNKKPANTLRCGNIKATIWENASEKGPFFAATFSRPFKDQSGAWRNGTSFDLNDLEALSTSRLTPRIGLPLTRSNVEGVNGKPPALWGLPSHMRSLSLVQKSCVPSTDMFSRFSMVLGKSFPRFKNKWFWLHSHCAQRRPK